MEETLTDFRLVDSYGSEFGRHINKRMRRLEPCGLDEIPENVKFIEISDFSHHLLERIAVNFFKSKNKIQIVLLGKITRFI